MKKLLFTLYPIIINACSRVQYCFNHKPIAIEKMTNDGFLVRRNVRLLSGIYNSARNKVKFVISQIEE
jgi:hypothetical protein